MLTILCRLCNLKALQHSTLELVHLDTCMYVHVLVQLDRGERRQDKTPRLCSMCPCSMTSVQCLLLGLLNREEEGRHCVAFLAFASQCRIPGGQHALSPLCLPLMSCPPQLRHFNAPQIAQFTTAHYTTHNTTFNFLLLIVSGQ